MKGFSSSSSQVFSQKPDQLWNVISSENNLNYTHPFCKTNEITNEDEELLGHLLLVSSQVAKEEGLDNWRTIINTGEEAGQTVFHQHIHVIGGRPLSWPPG